MRHYAFLVAGLVRDRYSNWHKLLVQLREQVLDLVFPPRCINCHRLGAVLCTQCQSDINPVLPPWCEYCGRAITHRDRVCAECSKQPLRIEAIRAVGYHEGPLREAVHAFKYGNRIGLDKILGRFLADWLEDQSWVADFIVPVPLHPDRQVERGYNQAALLARAVSARTGIELLEFGLVRSRPTRDQVGLDRTTRRNNVSEAFQTNDVRVNGKGVIVIDDVTTTGATLEACAIALNNSGAKRVRGLAVSRPRWQTEI